MKTTSIRAALLVLSGALGALTAPAVASAHALLDDAIARADEADFEGALASFERAASADDLSEAEVVTLLARRSAVHLALGHAPEAERDLRGLAALRPDYQFELWAPPVLRESFERARTAAERLALALESEAVDGATRLATTTRGDPGGLVRAVRIFVRAREGGEWRRVDGTSHVEPALSLEAYAEAIGPGGAVIARDGSAAAPHVLGPQIDPAALAAEPTEGEHDDGTLWWIVGGGTAAVGIAIAITAIVLSTGGSGSSEQTAFGPPLVRMP